MTTEIQGRMDWTCSVKDFKVHEDRRPKRVMIERKGEFITAMFDPNALTETGFIGCFAEPEEVAVFVTYKRGQN